MFGPFECYQVGCWHRLPVVCAEFDHSTLALGGCVGFPGSQAHTLNRMSLIPRWRYMTDEAKVLTKRTAVSALVVVVVLLVFRALLPWVLLSLAGWWVWKAFSK